MKPLILIAASAVALAVSGAAAADRGAPGPDSRLAPAFDGTIVSTYPDGRKAKLWLSADGSYTAEGRRHDRSSGHWRVKGERICLRQSRPPMLPISYCTPLPSGESWTAKAVTGEPIKVRLLPGRAG